MMNIGEQMTGSDSRPLTMSSSDMRVFLPVFYCLVSLPDFVA
jgi:hypothetical protein